MRDVICGCNAVLGKIENSYKRLVFKTSQRS
jgi:hypothetical protein